MTSPHAPTLAQIAALFVKIIAHEIGADDRTELDSFVRDYARESDLIKPRADAFALYLAAAVSNIIHFDGSKFPSRTRYQLFQVSKILLATQPTRCKQFHGNIDTSAIVAARIGDDKFRNFTDMLFHDLVAYVVLAKACHLGDTHTDRKLLNELRWVLVHSKMVFKVFTETHPSKCGRPSYDALNASIKGLQKPQWLNPHATHTFSTTQPCPVPVGTSAACWNTVLCASPTAP